MRGVRAECVNFLCGCPNRGRTVCDMEVIVAMTITIEVVEERLTPRVGVPRGAAAAVPSSAMVAHASVSCSCCGCWSWADQLDTSQFFFDCRAHAKASESPAKLSEEDTVGAAVV